MSESCNIWFDSPQTWVIPVLPVQGGVTLNAAQVVDMDNLWTSDARYPEDVPALMEAHRGDWVVEMEDGHRRLFLDAVFREQFVPSGMELRVLSYETQRRAEEQRMLADYQEGPAYRLVADAANRLLAFSRACRDLGERNTWEVTSQPVYQERSDAKVRDVDAARPKKVQDALEKMQKAFAGELPLKVWITRSIWQEFPTNVVQQVMQSIAERGSSSGGPVVFDSVGRHRDTALDAILRAGSEYTLGIPIEDSLSQKHWETRGIGASSRMVDLARDLLAPREMEAIRQANPGEVVTMPFNRDGFFNDQDNLGRQQAHPDHGREGGA